MISRQLGRAPVNDVLSDKELGDCGVWARCSSSSVDFLFTCIRTTACRRLSCPAGFVMSVGQPAICRVSLPWWHVTCPIHVRYGWRNDSRYLSAVNASLMLPLLTACVNKRSQTRFYVKFEIFVRDVLPRAFTVVVVTDSGSSDISSNSSVIADVSGALDRLSGLSWSPWTAWRTSHLVNVCQLTMPHWRVPAESAVRHTQVVFMWLFDYTLHWSRSTI